MVLFVILTFDHVLKMAKLLLEESYSMFKRTRTKEIQELWKNCQVNEWLASNFEKMVTTDIKM